MKTDLRKKKSLSERVTDLEQINQSTVLHFEAFLNQISEFVATSHATLMKIQDQEKQTQEWLQEFHRHVIAEYGKGPQSRVYGLIFTKRTSGKQKMVLVFAENFEDSLKICEEAFLQDNESFSEWQIE